MSNFWNDLFFEDKELIVRQLNDTFNFTSYYDHANEAAHSVRVGFENDSSWFDFGVADLDAFEHDIEFYINYLYFNHE